MDAGILQSVSEISIGLAGFGGIVAGLGYRAKGKWLLEDRLRLYALIFSSLSVVFACYLPFVIDGLWPDSTWRVSAGLFLFVPVIIVVAGVWSSRVLVPGRFSRMRLALAWLANLSAIGLLITILVGKDLETYSTLYLASVLAVLFSASTNFVGLVFASFQSSD